jgi:hypothetical protein
VKSLEAKVEGLERRVDRLMTELEDERRAGKRQAATWMAEQEIRPGVVNRRTSGGSRSDRGAEAQATLPSVIRTARRQRREPVGLMVRLLRERDHVDLGLARGPQGRARLVPFPCAQARASPAA